MSFCGIIIDSYFLFSSHSHAESKWQTWSQFLDRFYVYNTPGSIYFWKLLIADQTPEEWSFISLKPL